MTIFPEHDTVSHPNQRRRTSRPNPMGRYFNDVMLLKRCQDLADAELAKPQPDPFVMHQLTQHINELKRDIAAYERGGDE